LRPIGFVCGRSLASSALLALSVFFYAFAVFIQNDEDEKQDEENSEESPAFRYLVWVRYFA
jgi:hypothetical protein